MNRPRKPVFFVLAAQALAVMMLATFVYVDSHGPYGLISTSPSISTGMSNGN
jgi:hypothetical protein